MPNPCEIDFLLFAIRKNLTVSSQGRRKIAILQVYFCWCLFICLDMERILTDAHIISISTTLVDTYLEFLNNLHTGCVPKIPTL